MHWPYKQLLVLQILLFRIESCESQNNNDKQDFCSNLYCENERSSSACGIREEGEGFKLRLFENNCELMKYGCEVEDEKAYGIINPEYCKQLFMDGNNINKPESYMDDLESETVSPCVEFDCSYPTDAKEVCGIRQDGRGFKVRMFTNKCQLITHNCMNKTNFTRTDLLFCNGVDVPEDTNSNVMKVRRRVYRRAPNVVVIDANMFNFNNNITEAVDNFFAATHVFDLPIDEMNKHVNETARRMLINIFGPQVVFKPWIYIPTNISEDAMHSPTLSSCFHKCPTVCPNTYAPVCGQPGLAAREPSLMFMNHCYMDAAQCKMRWEANSDTAESSCDWKGGLKVRFGVNALGFGTDYFMSVPRTVAEAKSARWVETERPAGPLPSLVLYCPSQDDRILCAMYDDTNYVCGTQIALPVDEYEDAVLDWETLGFTLWSPPATTTGVVRNYWTQQQYFINEATLEISAADRIEARDESKTLQEESVWVTGFNKERLEISTDADKIADTATSGFTQQACVVLMGRHYYYNMTATTPCTADGLLPWFPLVHSGELIGMGFIAFGKLPETKLVKDYFERPDRSAVEMIVPDGPTCLYELADNPALVTMHTYFIDAPWLINCVGQ